MKTRTLRGWLRYYGYQLNGYHSAKDKRLLTSDEFDYFLVSVGEDIEWKMGGEFFQWYVDKYFKWRMREFE